MKECKGNKKKINPQKGVFHLFFSFLAMCCGLFGLSGLKGSSKIFSWGGSVWRGTLGYN